MADEIKATSALELTNGSLRHCKTPLSDQGAYHITVDQTVPGSAVGSQNLAAAVEDLDIGDLTDPGWARFVNVSGGTQIIWIRYYDGSSSHKILELQPGEVAGPMPLMPLTGAQKWEVEADQAAAQLYREIFER